MVRNRKTSTWKVPGCLQPKKTSLLPSDQPVFLSVVWTFWSFACHSIWPIQKQNRSKIIKAKKMPTIQLETKFVTLHAKFHVFNLKIETIACFDLAKPGPGQILLNPDPDWTKCWKIFSRKIWICVKIFVIWYFSVFSD